MRERLGVSASNHSTKIMASEREILSSITKALVPRYSLVAIRPIIFLSGPHTESGQNSVADSDCSPLRIIAVPSRKEVIDVWRDARNILV